MENKFLKYFIVLYIFLFNTVSFSFSDIITKIEISGNISINSSELFLLIKSQTGNVFNAETLQKDINRIYKTGFFADVGADTEKLSGGLKIIFKVIENNVIKKISFKNNNVFSARILNKVILLKEGNVFNFNSLKEDIYSIEKFYSSRGYVLSRVNDVEVLEDGSEIVFLISEPLIESIEISGNEETSDEIIYKKLNIYKGDFYNYHNVVRGIDELRKIEAFEDIRFFINSGKNHNMVIIKIEVVEKKTGEIDFGLSYGEFNGFVGSVSFEKKNFRGKAERIKFLTEFGEVRNFDFKYSIPYFIKRLSGDINIFDYSLDKEKYNQVGLYQYDYKEKRDGFKLTLGNEMVKKNIEYEYISENIKMEIPGTIILENREWIKLRGINQLHNGKFKWETGVTGKLFLDGDQGYFTYLADRSFFVKKDKKIDALRIKTERISVSESKLREFEKVSVGGRDSLRGYKSSVFSSDSYILINIEERLKVNEKLWYVVFADIANINGKLKKTAGIGFAFYSPLGIIRLDYGKPVDDIIYKKGRIYLGIGYMF
ncbi:MAG: BamA/TamA family outer membrane protein [Candidatus Muirbacterium halophilum]|nr:BamA/TamA family outer membrane protein [Candidatus Muirbacterium halophilum]MCK9474774.1 BamA/TamA family outer membrane protein [Candidatus Muirbacterium halophilum]